jgi:hypothetical protein
MPGRLASRSAAWRWLWTSSLAVARGGYGQAHDSLGRIARFVAKREREEGLCFMAHLLGALPDTVGVLRLAKQSVVALEVLERRAAHLRI